MGNIFVEEFLEEVDRLKDDDDYYLINKLFEAILKMNAEVKEERRIYNEENFKLLDKNLNKEEEEEKPLTKFEWFDKNLSWVEKNLIDPDPKKRLMAERCKETERLMAEKCKETEKTNLEWLQSQLTLNQVLNENKLKWDLDSYPERNPLQNKFVQDFMDEEKKKSEEKYYK